MLRLAFILIFLLASKSIAGERYRIFPAVGNAKAVVLMVHGLNVRPSKMDTLAEVLASWGYAVVRPALSGHRGVPWEMQKSSMSVWSQEVASWLKTIIALNPSLPIYYVGSSMSGVLINDVLERDQELKAHVKKTILIAPALAFPLLVRWSLNLPLDNRFPLAPSAEWDVDYVHVGAYRSLMDSYQRGYASQFSGLSGPTLILLHPDDKVVSSQAIAKLPHKFGKRNWTIEMLPSDSHPDNSNNHLLVDETTVAAPTWPIMLEKIGKFLDK